MDNIESQIEDVSSDLKENKREQDETQKSLKQIESSIQKLSSDQAVVESLQGNRELKEEELAEVQEKNNELVNRITDIISTIKEEQASDGQSYGQLEGLESIGEDVSDAIAVLDEKNEVIRPAILWNDGRTAKECDYLNQVIGKERLSEYTANISFTGFTAPKVLWMKENEPENFAKIQKLLLPKDYLAFRLSGNYSTDVSDASGTLFFDVKNRCWSKEMCDICGIKEEWLPEVYESYEVVGTLLPELAKQLGLPENVKIVAGAGDNAAAAVGTGTVGDGACNISLGTSGTVFIASEKRSKHWEKTMCFSSHI